MTIGDNKKTQGCFVSIIVMNRNLARRRSREEKNWSVKEREEEDR